MLRMTVLFFGINFGGFDDTHGGPMNTTSTAMIDVMSSMPQVNQTPKENHANPDNPQKGTLTFNSLPGLAA